VRSAQQETDRELSNSKAALAAANAACSSSPSTTEPTPDSSSPADPAPTQSAVPSSSDCTAAGAALLAEQEAVDRAQQKLADAEAALSSKLMAMLATVQGSSQTSSATQAPSPSRSVTSVTASAADIALDQADIDQARASVTAAKADLAQTVLRATISGRVAAVNVKHGDRVGASSATAAVTIVGSRQQQTIVNLTATEIRRVKVGMVSQVVVDGSSKVLAGRVVGINAAGVQSSSGSVTYPVTITLPPGSAVVSGAAAAVTIVVASVADVLSVPTSAVHYNGTASYVQVLEDGEQSRRTVKVGATGAALTQIESGVADGDEVILADLDAPLPSTSSSLNVRGGFGGGGGGFARRFSGTGGGSPAVPRSGGSSG
jgi:HlyD family secretion protein